MCFSALSSPVVYLQWQLLNSPVSQLIHDYCLELVGDIACYVINHRLVWFEHLASFGGIGSISSISVASIVSEATILSIVSFLDDLCGNSLKSVGRDPQKFMNSGRKPMSFYSFLPISWRITRGQVVSQTTRGQRDFLRRS